MTARQKKYAQFAQRNGTPLFSQPWWLNACAQGKSWTVAFGGEVGIPFLLRKKAGLNVGFPFPYTQGVEVAASCNVATLVADLKAQKFQYFNQHIYTDAQTAQNFRERGFLVEERVTYRIEKLREKTNFEKSFSQNKRRQLKRALKQNLRLEEGLSASDFYAFHRQCLAKRGEKIGYTEDLFHSIYTAAVTHQAGKILAVRNETNDLLAAVFLVWDAQSCYFLIPTYDKFFAYTGAMTWLTLQCIYFAQTISEAFDFEGSKVPSIAESYSQFGTEKKIYYGLQWGNAVSRLLVKSYFLFRGWNFCIVSRK